MQNKARPKVRAQVAPEALALLDPLFRVPEGYTDDGVPNFTGIPAEVWRELAAKPEIFWSLLGILETDYPTFAALVQKIWAKKVGHRIPLIFNLTQRLEWDRIARRLAGRQALLIAILKARQQGMSTLVNGMAHWQVWRLKDVECNLFVHEKPLAYSFIDRLRIFHDELPKVPGIERSLRAQQQNARVPKDELYYAETLSKITTIVVEKNTEARGRSALHNHLAEYASYPTASTLLGSLMPQLPPAGSAARLQCSVIIESTPKGKNDFYELWQLAKSGESEWHADFFPWYVAEDEYAITPPHGWKMDDTQREWVKNLAHLRKAIDGVERISPAQVYWYEQTLATECEGNQDVMDAEYPSDDETCFLMRSRSIFKADMRYLHATVLESERNAPDEFKKIKPPWICTQRFLRGRLEYEVPDNPFGNRAPRMEQLKLRPRFVPCPDGPLYLWAPPLPDHHYVVGIDPAAGLMDSDNSVCELIDVTTGRQMGEYAARVSPEKIADDSVALGWMFNTALLYPEINSIGVVTMKRIKQLWMYPRLGREEKWDEIALKANKYGHYTTPEQKNIMVSFLRHSIAERYLAISSDGLLSELSTFVQTAAGDFEADANNKDDRVMALALACVAIRQSPRMLADFTKEPHRMRLASAVESMINDSPTPSAAETERAMLASLPQNVREGLFGAEILGVPANPIRGPLEVVF